MKKFSFDGIQDSLNTIPREIKQQTISILLPYYNEEDIIVQNISLILEKMREWGLHAEIVVSDDGSQGQGFELLNQVFGRHSQVKLIRSHRNYGKGRALSTAYEESTGDYILFLDSDLELSIEHLPYFLNKMIDSQADVVIGSKEDPASQIDYPLIRRILSKSYYWITKLLFNLHVKDTQTGIKLFKRKVLEETLPYLLVKRFAFDIELLALIQYRSYKIVSHPIVFHYIRQQLGRMSLDTALHIAKDTVAVFWRLKSEFWKNVVLGKADLRYVILSFDPNDQGQNDIFYLQHINQLSYVMPLISSYDIVLFKSLGEEIPIFTMHSLNRIFVDPSIYAVLPLLYPYSMEIQEELYYTVIGNLFFSRGFYPRYRPMAQAFITNSFHEQLVFKTSAIIYRREFLEQLIQQNNGTLENMTQFTGIVHTPFCFFHKQFPKNLKEFQYFCKHHTNKVVGLKKIARSLYLFCMLLSFLAVFFQFSTLIWPLVVLELGIHVWYLYSLGIRKGVRYLILFDVIRFYHVLSTTQVYIYSVLKMIIKKN
ncbi:MAG: glycosyltransferase family 2 protein [Brevinema sp.]